MAISLRIEPADDPELVEAGRDLMRALAGTEPEEATGDGSEVPRRGAEWVAVAALILSAPASAQALLAVLDRLSRGRDRQPTRARIEPPLTRARAAASGRRVTLSVGDLTLDLGDASADAVLDALASAGVAARSERS